MMLYNISNKGSMKGCSGDLARLEPNINEKISLNCIASDHDDLRGDSVRSRDLAVS